MTSVSSYSSRLVETVSFMNRDSSCEIFTRINHQSCGSASGKTRQHRLFEEEHVGNPELLEKEFACFLPELLVFCSLSSDIFRQQNGVLIEIRSQFFT